MKTDCLSTPRSIIVAAYMINWLIERFRLLGNGDIVSGATAAMVLPAHERGTALY